MSAPTALVRAQMLHRDGHRCVLCGASTQLEAQHRRAVGMGGSGVRPDVTDLVTACSSDNAGFEAHLQTLALFAGLKVRSWVREPERVPVFVAYEHRWFRLTFDGLRARLSAQAAAVMMRDVYGPEWDAWAVMVPFGLRLWSGYVEPAVES